MYEIPVDQQIFLTLVKDNLHKGTNVAEVGHMCRHQPVNDSRQTVAWCHSDVLSIY